MDSQYSLKPYSSVEAPHLKWAVSGPSDDGPRRWRKLFETLEEAQSFLRQKQANPPDAIPADKKETVTAVTPSESIPPREVRRRSPFRFRKRTYSERVVLLQIALAATALIVMVSLADRALRKTPPRVESNVVLSENFDADPISSGWSASPTGTDWIPVTEGASDRAIMVESGTWSSPLVDTDPLQWYRLAFKSRAPGKVTDMGGVGYGYCRVCFVDGAGRQLTGDDVSPILQSDGWRWNELRVRARPLANINGGLLATKLRVVFTPIGGQPFFVDNVTIERVSAREVTGWADKSYAVIPARLEYRPKASRWARIPSTMQKLREGRRLRIVMLGDSVQQDLASAPIDAMLERYYAGSHVEIVASTKGGAGVSFFKDHLSEYVTQFHPDLLIIGGISNGAGIPAFQEIVDHIRANDTNSGNTTEIMILSRSWSPNGGAGGHAGAFFLTPQMKELDQDTTDSPILPDDERGQLLKFAKANRVEFLDMSGIVGEFIFGPAKAAGVGPPETAEGAPYRFWMRDWVHPNGDGRQIMARVLVQYFLPERSGSIRTGDVERVTE